MTGSCVGVVRCGWLVDGVIVDGVGVGDSRSVLMVLALAVVAASFVAVGGVTVSFVGGAWLVVVTARRWVLAAPS